MYYFCLFSFFLVCFFPNDKTSDHSPSVSWASLCTISFTKENIFPVVYSFQYVALEQQLPNLVKAATTWGSKIQITLNLVLIMLFGIAWNYLSIALKVCKLMLLCKIMQKGYKQIFVILWVFLRDVNLNFFLNAPSHKWYEVL